ncbi:hypothetical protein E3983_02000 [Legionella israelensis]|uniref:Coiled-coil protein n=1 Tax=Legionella israelensis TaxID=454 RepID=A0AAX1EDP3_9GAMM|nr:hypothetical protein [Legionella israelensis]QBR83236.1 hypothetical protein E3983_02000 [Legionella israelensis]
MNASIWTLNEYLFALKEHKIEGVSRPFDTKSPYIVEMGPIATSLKLPEITLEEFIPPTAQVIKKLYLVLQPVLEELVQSEQFDRNAKYGSLSASAVAKAYLFNAINKIYKKTAVQLTPAQIAYQDFLRRVSDSLVDEIPPEKFCEHIVEHSLVKDFYSIVSHFTLEYPDKSSLLTHFFKKQAYVLAYKTSMLSEKELEDELTSHLKETLLQLIKLNEDKTVKKRSSLFFSSSDKSAKLPDAEQIRNIHDMERILSYFDQFLRYILKHQSKDVSVIILKEIKNNPFFMNSLPEEKEQLEKKGLVEKNIKRLQKQIDSSLKLISAHQNQMLRLKEEGLTPSSEKITAQDRPLL